MISEIQHESAVMQSNLARLKETNDKQLDNTTYKRNKLFTISAQIEVCQIELRKLNKIALEDVK